jgi:uncharacterized protein (DUF983 family)
VAEPTRPAVGFTGPSRGRELWRGLTRRCPVCGCFGIGSGYFRLKERCPRCGLRFARMAGHWSGDIGINTIVTFGLLFVVVLGGTLLMWSRLNVALLAAAAVGVVLVFPVLFVPVAKTLWVAVDLMMRPVEPAELDPAYVERVAAGT